MPYIFKRIAVQLNDDQPSENWLELAGPTPVDIKIHAEYRTLNEDIDLPITVRVTAGGVQDLLSGQKLEISNELRTKIFEITGLTLLPEFKELEVKIIGTGLIETRRFRMRVSSNQMA